MMEVPGGLDFAGAKMDPELGKMCILREDLVQTVERQPRLHCDIKYGFREAFKKQDQMSIDAIGSALEI